MNRLLLLVLILIAVIGRNNRVSSFLSPMPQRMLFLKITKVRTFFGRQKMTVQSTSTIGVSNELETRFLSTDIIQLKLKEDSNFFQNKSNNASVQFSPFTSTSTNNITRTTGSTSTTNATNNNNKKLLHIIRHAQGTHNVNREYRNPKHRDAQLTQLGIEQCLQVATRIKSIIEQNQGQGQEQLQDDNDNDNDDNIIGLQSLFNAITNNESIIIVTSPMIRCIQTTLYCFIPLIEYYIYINHRKPSQNATLSIIVHDTIRETVNYECDHRTTIHEIQTTIQQQFPIHITSLINYTSNVETNHDNIWDYYLTKCGPPAPIPISTSTSDSNSDTSTAQNVWIQHRESAEIHKVAERGRLFFEWLGTTRNEQHVVICSHAAFLRCITNFAIDNDNNIDDTTGSSTSTTRSSIPMLPKQLLNPNYPNCSIDWIPVIQYTGDNNDSNDSNDSNNVDNFKSYMRKDFQNCELRSVVATFPSQKSNQETNTCK